MLRFEDIVAFAEFDREEQRIIRSMGCLFQMRPAPGGRQTIGEFSGDPAPGSKFREAEHD